MNIQGYFLPNNLQTISFPALTNVGGDLTASSWANLTTVSLPVLTKTSALKINGLSLLTSITAPKLQSALGDVDLSANQALTTLDVSSLQSIGGLFAFGSNSTMDNLNAFKTLTSVGGDLNLSEMPSLTDISGLKNLQKVGGRFTLQDLPALTDDGLSGLSSLKTIGGDVQILGVPFKNFRGFATTKLQSVTIDGSGLTTIQQIDLSGVDISSFVTITGVTGGVAVKGKDVLNGDLDIERSDISLSGFKQVNNFTFNYHDNDPAPSNPTNTLPMQKINGTVSITINGYHTLSLPNLATVSGDFTISTGYDIYSLTDLQAPLLTKIGGILFVTGQNGSSPNNLMTNLNGFPGLTSAQSVTIINNQALTDFTGLKNVIPSLSAASWSVGNNGYNPSYQDMVDGKYTP